MGNLLQVTTVPVGSVYSDQIIEVASSDISSICSWRMNPALHVQPIGATAFPFNFDDLNGPIPASAYTCIPQCLAGCSSIVSENWLAGLGLAVPTQIQKIDPAWASCVPYFLGVPDPPIALSGVDNFLSTADAPPKTSDAAPGTTPEAVVTATNDPKPTSRPNFPNDPSSPQSTKVSNNDPPNGRPNGSNPNDPVSSAPAKDPPNNETPNGRDPTHEPVAAMPVFVSFTRTTPIPQRTATAGRNTPTSAIAAIGGSPIEIDPSNPSAIIIGDPGAPDSHTLSIGDTPLVISGTTISVAPTGGALIISGQSKLIPLGTVSGETIWRDPSRPEVVLIGDPNSSEQMQTLSLSGNAVVISGTTVSLAQPTGGATVPVTTSIMGLSLVLDPPSGTLKVNGEYVLQPGSAQISVNGHAVYFDPSGQNVVIDGVSYAFADLPHLVIGYDDVTSTLRADGYAAVTSAPTERSDTQSVSKSTIKPTRASNSNTERPLDSESAGDTTNESSPIDTAKPGAAARSLLSYWLPSSGLLLSMMLTDAAWI
ncbi:uncharacterized protein N0V89_005812 [Didymosphaeria variabile]|uniref:Uncharacterized protein n=1 Tax=Didymosphaeria variabile TaxID=1932322 RepID=A0A9W8XM49_9PLEO|nr:uncharacterized protein N0V89_005812 [Didymosphaeria variabile]KAJ4354079.1 hypothetical protein N0V89_005812 [Didymosphaeria variabile]